MTDFVRLTRHGEHVAVVTLDRPPVNALGRQIREEFIDVLDQLQERDQVRAIVLAASGRVFSAGADIKEKQALGESAPGDQQRADRLTRESFFALSDSVKPVIAAVSGAALGAGFIMVACCDVIVAGASASFGMPEIDVGQGGGASFLRRLLPLTTMRRMLLTGERVSAGELARLGVLECVPDDEVLPRALAIAEIVARKSPNAVRTVRESFSAVGELSLRDGFQLEQKYTARLSRSPDAEEARAAFFEKREPDF